MKRAVALLVLVLTSIVRAQAQSLPQHETVVQKLEVRILTERADRTVVTVGTPFHLKIHAVFAQSLTHIDNLNLPALEDFDHTSSERHFTPSADGTLFDETLTLVPKHPGTIEIGPVSIDAINARTQLASKFSSTDQVIMHVLPQLPRAERISGSVLAQYAAIAAIALSVAVLTFQIGSMLLRWFNDGLRGQQKSNPIQPAPKTALAPPKPPLKRLRDAVEQIKRDPSQANAEEVRSALRDSVGASDEETLADIIERMPQNRLGIFDRALRAAERAAFIETAYRLSAIEDGLPLFEAALRRLES